MNFSILLKSGVNFHVELTLNTKGIAKGGSWKNSPKESVLGKTQLYSGPSIDLGFRVCMKVIE